MRPIIKINSRTMFPIGLGAMPLSIAGRPSESEAKDVIATFVNHGGNWIDTADVYGLNSEDSGHNERLIHRVLKEMGCENDVLVSTKGGATRPDGAWELGGGHPDKLRTACEQSLINLNIQAHELYYLHGPDPMVPLEDSLGELTRLREEGKIIHLGIANVDYQELQFASAITTISAVQNRCNTFCKTDFNNGIINLCEERKILYVPYCPLGGWADHATLAASELYKKISNKYGITSYQVALAWLLSKSNQIVPIPGMDKSEQVSQNFQAINILLEAADIQEIDEFPDLYSPKHVSK